MEKTSCYTPAQLRSELERCLYCAEKPCQEACPAHCSPADFIQAARGGNPSDFVRSALLILKANPLGEVCGVVCPDSFCMAACARKGFDSPVQIPRIQASIVRQARELGPLPVPEKPPETGKKVAIVGAGPAGLAAAAYLGRKGHVVDLYDEEKAAGGACRMIPEDRLPKAILKEDIDYVLKLGTIRTHFGKRIEKPEALLQTGADAVLVACGEPEPSLMGIPGEGLAVSSIQYLKNPGHYPGKRVAILGGGAVAADCAATARRRGAEAVEMFVRRTVGEMRLTPFERQMLLDHSIDLTTRTRVQAIARQKGKLCLTVTKVEPASGKGKARMPSNASSGPGLVDIPGTSVKRPGFDVVVLALGSGWSGERSGDKRVFYAGDCVHGSSTVVQAVASGKNAARELELFLELSRERATPAERRAAVQELKEQGRSCAQSRIKSRIGLPEVDRLPVSLETDFFGTRISSPFLLSAAPATDGLEQMKKAYEMGWAGGVMKTAFDNVPIHIPASYMVTFNDAATTHGNCDNVSEHPLDRVCRELEELRRLYPDRLTMASTGGPVTGRDEQDARVWQSNTRKLERAGALGVEYSLSCPQGGDGTEGDIVSQNAVLTAKVIDWVMQMSDPQVPKLFKLTGAVTSLKPILAAIEKVFAKYPGKKAGVTLANSFPVLAFRKPHQGGSAKGQWTEAVIVGMSGEGVLPMSYLSLANAAAFGIPVSGNGGVMNYEAAAHFLALGARTVQLCTAVTHYGLGILGELNSGLSYYLQSRGLKSVRELIGIAGARPVTGFNDLPAIKRVSQVDPALCRSCGNCTRCPYLAITLDRKKQPVTDPARCVGCSICVKSCFAGALFMRERTPRELAASKE